MILKISHAIIENIFYVHTRLFQQHLSQLALSLLYLLPSHAGQPGRQTGLEKAKATRTRQSPGLTTLAREEVKKGTATLRDGETYNIARGEAARLEKHSARSPNDNYFRPDVPLSRMPNTFRPMHRVERETKGGRE